MANKKVKGWILTILGVLFIFSLFIWNNTFRNVAFPGTGELIMEYFLAFSIPSVIIGLILLFIGIRILRK